MSHYDWIQDRKRRTMAAMTSCVDHEIGRVVEAAKARYVWFEMLALADLLKWCAAGEAADVRSRLRGVASRLASSKAELAGVIDEGAL